MSKYFASIVFALFLVAVGGVYYWLRHQEQHFRISTVNVVSSYQLVSKAQIEQLVSPWVNTTFFRVNLHQITQALGTLPGLKTMIVERQWPHSVVIKLQERQAVAQWPHHVLMDKTGHFFTAKAIQTKQPLPQFSGDRHQAKKMWAIYHRLSQQLASLGLTIIKLNYDGAEAWSVTLNTGLKVFFSDDHLQRELKTLMASYPELIAQHPKKKIAYLNMRYPHGFAVG